jgi:hypothetical protein
MKTHILKFLILGFVIFVSCEKQSIDAIPDDQKLAQLRAEIEAFAKNKACSNGDNCKVLGIGAKPCGGPSEYIIYSLTNTDEKQLISKVNEYTNFQKEYNVKNQLVSDCLLIPIPTVDCVNGICTAK